MRRLLPVGVVLCLLGLTACTGEGDVGSLPSTRPSVEATADRTLPTRTEEPEPTKTTEKTKDPEPTKTTKDPEPTKTKDPEPTKTTEKPQPADTRTVEVTVTKVETTTTTPKAPESSSPAVVAVADEDSSSGFLGWFLLFLLFGGLAAAVLIARSKRTSTWDSEAASLSAETRMITESRLLSILGMREAERRGLAWPPVRDDLTGLSVRWGALGAQNIDGARQARARELAVLLRDLAVAVDAENEALATGREWQLLRPQVEQILDTIEATMTPTEAPLR
ncbi:hypothetical protein Q0Z83_020090 [Actinoplanes sichuanensis]|uniref:DUF4129 domain-containing protein n=1 Tax=Actinoplanes sichuanensis TaxID=512349 RepID=A0ABW4AKB1_9ACTN|nr:hypothetical protein [Actinoplanes sichuanensis]BEL03818.1 hypothetical protein Q0Z83_020090 [Actinoplanes sichuanensis]